MNPKYKLNQRVYYKGGRKSCPSYGVIVKEPSRTYRAIFENGEFDNRGLNIMESDLSSITVPWKVERDLLTIIHPAGHMGIGSPERHYKYKFHHWTYVVDLEKTYLGNNVLSVLSENQITPA